MFIWRYPQADLEDPHHRQDEQHAQDQQQEGIGRAARPVLPFEEPLLDGLGEPARAGEPSRAGTRRTTPTA